MLHSPMTNAKNSHTRKKSTAKHGRIGSSKQQRWWITLVRVILTVLTIISALGLIAASYGGDFRPSVYRGICIMVMLMPIWMIAIVTSTVLNALWNRKALIINIITFVACGTALWNFCPLNILGPSESKYENCPKFSILSYNVCNFESQDTIYPNDMNPAISFLIRSNADIVCLQEAANFKPISNSIKIPAAQVDSLNRMYPYIMTNGRTQMILSKYPVESVPTGYAKANSNEIAVFRAKVEGTPITIFNVHLQPYNLRPDDKSLYADITDLKKNKESVRENVSEIKSQLLRKIQTAAEGRELDAERLGTYISSLGGPNVIVTGDFNDVPGCYTLRRLADHNMAEVYPEVGFGPMITYYANRFYFRIDHTLYRGNLQPLKMTRPKTRNSDHYPIISTFAITGDEK